MTSPDVKKDIPTNLFCSCFAAKVNSSASFNVLSMHNIFLESENKFCVVSTLKGCLIYNRCNISCFIILSFYHKLVFFGRGTMFHCCHCHSSTTILSVCNCLDIYHYNSNDQSTHNFPQSSCQSKNHCSIITLIIILII